MNATYSLENDRQTEPNTLPNVHGHAHNEYYQMNTATALSRQVVCSLTSHSAFPCFIYSSQREFGYRSIGQEPQVRFAHLLEISITVIR